MLYTYTPQWNVYIILKATLKDHPWISGLQEWLAKDDIKYRMANIKFISYDNRKKLHRKSTFRKRE